MPAKYQEQANVLRTIETELHEVRSEGSTLGTKPRRTSSGTEETQEERTFEGRHVPGGCTGLRKAIL